MKNGENKFEVEIEELGNNEINVKTTFNKDSNATSVLTALAQIHDTIKEKLDAVTTDVIKRNKLTIEDLSS